MTAQWAIGEFSRITQLSVKTLRRYHGVGLLGPDRVDAATGFRYHIRAIAAQSPERTHSQCLQPM